MESINQLYVGCRKAIECCSGLDLSSRRQPSVSYGLCVLRTVYACLTRWCARREGIEAVLQTHLFAGYPRTLNALTALHHAGAPTREAVESPEV
jgi:alkylhydroperoxidase/carboxymuconolactone decarboxylase family protein YurZ